MDWRERITVDPAVCRGQACIKGICANSSNRLSAKQPPPIKTSAIGQKLIGPVSLSSLIDMWL